jgi:hypothetical protein
LKIEGDICPRMRPRRSEEQAASLKVQEAVGTRGLQAESRSTQAGREQEGNLKTGAEIKV